MVIEAEVLIQSIHEPIDLSCPKKLRNNTLINEINISKKELSRLRLAKIISLGFAETFLLAGGLTEDSILVGIGGASLYLATRLRNHYLEAKSKYISLQSEKEKRRIVLLTPDGRMLV